MARRACSERGASRDPRSAWAFSISPSVIPASSKGRTTSVLHQSVSVSAIRARLSPKTRSHRSMTTGRNPLESWSSIADTTDSSSSRTWSSGRGSAKPTASRTTFRSSRGTPVRSLSSRKVVPLTPANRSKAVTSRKEKERAPSRTATAMPSSGTPARSKALHPTRPEHVTRREHVSRARLQDPELDQPVDVIEIDPRPPAHLLARVLAHERRS